MSYKGSLHTVDAERDGQRIDNFLFSRLKGVPKGLVYRLLRTGKIRVNGKRVKQTYRLQEEDEVKIPQISTSETAKPVIGEAIQQRIQESIIYEDDHILAINKPAGLAVHPGSRVPYGVIEVLRVLRPKAPFLELVHRLDRDTSGCLLIAKNKRSLNGLHDLMRQEIAERGSNEDLQLNKNYLLLVKGEWGLGEKVVDTALQTKGPKSTTASDADDEKNTWKQAYTIFKPLEHFKGFTLLNAQIKTGRTHQIRIHAAQTGFPIVGDTKHGDYAFNRECKKQGFKRMFLHASEISFQLPGTTERIEIHAPMSDELTSFMRGLDAG